MNIQKAKEEIKRTLQAYSRRTAEGLLRIPVNKQRPILLIGPPGIGKTAIMQQIATEENAGLVSYTMTHHTRQSAVGLPMLKEKTYQGHKVSVTEYTMSEIIASVYDCMEDTGCQKGILFIDEMNCVSETLAPVMLQLLQNKAFGCHKIPDGWLIVAAGNPPEYNRSVREFDMVTLDRVKNMAIEADLDAWLDYARDHQIHPAILSFLKLYPDSFYAIENKEGQTSFVTARGWEDLSLILQSYEEMQLPVEEELCLQYLQHQEISRNFYLFYQLFSSYTEDFAQGNYFSAKNEENLKKGDTTEAIAIAAMLFSRSALMMDEFLEKGKEGKRLTDLKEQFFSMLSGTTLSGDTAAEQLAHFIQKRKEANQIKEDHDLLSLSEKILEVRTIRLLEEILNSCRIHRYFTSEEIARVFEEFLSKRKEEQLGSSREILLFLKNSYELLENASSDLCLAYFTADLTGNTNCLEFLTQYQCESWLKYSATLITI